MVVKKINGLMMMFLMISMIFIIPISINSAYAAPTTQAGDVKNTCSVSPPLDIKSSFILSTVFLCIPGILEKVQDFRNIKCEKIICKYEAVSASLDPTFCEKEYSFKTCQNIVGEIFAIPPMAILDYMRKMIADALASPVGFIYSAAAIGARWHLKSCGASCNSFIYGAEAIFLGITDIAGAAQRISDIMENGFFPDDAYENACEDLDDIKEELEAIVENT